MNTLQNIICLVDVIMWVKAYDGTCPPNFFFTIGSSVIMNEFYVNENK